MPLGSLTMSTALFYCVAVPHSVPSVGSVSTAVFYCPSVPHNVPSVDSVSPFPLLSSNVCQYLTLFRSWFCVTMYTAVFYILSIV